LAEFRPELDPELVAIVARCLAKNPDDRYQDIAALGSALHAYAGARVATNAEGGVESTAFFHHSHSDVGDESSIAPVAAPPPPLVRRMRRAHVLAALGLLGTLVLAGLAFGTRSLRAARNATALVEPALANVRPTLATGPAPAPLDRGNEAIPLAVSATSTAPVPLAPTAINTVSVPPPPTAAGTVSGPPAPIATSAVSRPAAPAVTPTMASVATTPAREPRAAASPASDDEPPLTAAEIEARKERYARWLAEQGLKPVDEATDNPYH
jgi:hypothetical protein